MKKRRISRGIKAYLKHFVNVRGWMGYDNLAESTRHLTSTAKAVFKTPQGTGRIETSEQAMQRLQLTEQDIWQRQQEFMRLAAIFFVVMLVTLSYAFYLLSVGKFLGGIVAVGVTAIALAMAFRYHFWYIQIKKRKLGCTFKEWLDAGFR